MSHESQIHPVQTHILRELLFLPSASFTDLQKPLGLDADHFKFHIQRLVVLGYVEKVEYGVYALTQKGKEYANKLDTQDNTIERQPKSAVILVIKKQDCFLVQQRLKHPYFGFWGFPGGKIKWGETIIDAGQRELYEESNLVAELVYKGVYHEHAYNAETNELLEDKIFHILFGKVIDDTLATDFEGGRNAWLSIEEIKRLDKKYASFDTELAVGIGSIPFIEQSHHYSQKDF